ncbi:MAG TPA: bifunctional YncE family protein/alkaline phosphatase family protein, partial [Streptosporangiaceae bacterium]|nr:bifunctional YncE family protein/alkaline phosphatase family protein [Streptosporangiaceae bacterium]
SAVVALAVTGTGIAIGSTTGFGSDQVGQTVQQGLVVSDNQIISPYGDRLVLNNGKIMGSTVSPDGTHMAVTLADGSQAVGIVNLSNWTVQQYTSPGGHDVGQESPTYSRDGTQLWVGRNNGYTRFTVNPDGSLSNPVQISIPAQGGKQALVGKAVFSPDGSTVYSAVNGQNTVVAINAATGAIEQTWSVGNAPRDLVLVGSKLYVSNEGGRPAESGDTTVNSYGTQVPASDFTGAATTGTVSVIDTANPSAAPATINVGLHPTALYAKTGALFVTDTNSDTVSVIDTSSDKVVQTISTQPWPESKVGYEPDAVTLTDDGHLLVTLGGANAVAVYKYTSPRDPVSYLGMIPTDYFPSDITTLGNTVLVTNMRGIDARRSTTDAHGTHDTTASLTKFTLPSDGAIRAMTGTIFKNNGWTPGSIMYANSHSTAKPVPVPMRIGDPSTIKYVFLIVKENRTYDQQFGDIAKGNGDTAFNQFGAAVTPNNHALVQQFGLYDNFYDAGTNSAEGHNWMMQADNPAYTQSLAGQYIRSYDTEDDALGHQESGFIWTGAEAAGKTVRDFGEFQQFLTKPAGATWQNLYCDARNMESSPSATTAYQMTSTSPIPSLNNVSDTAFPKFDTSVPDIYREQIWKRDFEKNGPANLNMFWLSSDHTGGPPSPAAQVADNDLALGQMVDEISHSKYWPQSAIFVVEDDSQAGSDHVDGHRAPIQVISPWAQHGIVDNTYYSQINMVRTVEQILGIHPMNDKDSAATPMYTAFTTKPNYTRFDVVPNQTSLTAGLSTLPPCGADVPAGTTEARIAASTAVPANMKQVAAQWAQWLTKQRTTGPNAVPDYANPEQMNRYVWYQASDWKKPYPGDSKIYAPSQVPGAILPSSDQG